MGQGNWVAVNVVGLVAALICWHLDPTKSNVRRLLFAVAPAALCGVVGLNAGWGWWALGFAAWGALVSGLLYLGLVPEAGEKFLRNDH